MANKKNALAELARGLARDAKIIFAAGGGGPLSSAISARQKKASRILAELGKVEFYNNIFGEWFSPSDEVRHTLLKFRAIVKEGVSNGK